MRIPPAALFGANVASIDSKSSMTVLWEGISATLVKEASLCESKNSTVAVKLLTDVFINVRNPPTFGSCFRHIPSNACGVGH
jgi:hypothetical protein